MINEPALGNEFFGREDILGVLRKRVNALKGGYRQNVALTGQMLSGKSSILSQFLYSLKDSSLVPVYVEVVDEPFQSFADKFVATLLYNFLASVGRETKRDLKELLTSSENVIPHTVYAIKKIHGDLAKKNYTEAYKKLLNLTSILKKETGKSCVVILDEFHNLESFKIKKPYLHFGKIIMIQKDTMYIVSSSQKSTIKKILSERLALLFGNFEIMEVAGFDNKTAEAFLAEKLQNIELPGDYAHYLIDFTEGNPFYLDIISKKISEIALSRQAASVDEDIIVEAFSSLIYTTSGTINQYFTNSIMSLMEKDLRSGCLEILIALACGANRLKTIAQWFNKKSTADISKKLSHLSGLDIVSKNGSFYEIQDKVFKFWLRSVYHKRKTSLVDDVVNMANEFREEVKKDYRDYENQAKKSVLERLKELFLLFNGETVEIEKKRRILPKFLKIELQRYGAFNDLVTRQKDNKYWICEICRDKVDESVIFDFIARYYPMRDKVAKKICLALEGIDTNALLLAKEKNVWVWSLEHINSILRLYKRYNLIYK